MADDSWRPRSPDLTGLDQKSSSHGPQSPYDYRPRSPDLTAFKPDVSAFSRRSDPWTSPTQARPQNIPHVACAGAHNHSNYPTPPFHQQHPLPPQTGRHHSHSYHQPYRPVSSDCPAQPRHQSYAHYPHQPQDPMPTTRSQRVKHEDHEWNGHASHQDPSRPSYNGLSSPPPPPPQQPTYPLNETKPVVLQPVEVKTKFPTARIKRIMQADEDVGKVAQVAPIVMAKALELFMIRLISASAGVSKSRGSKRVLTAHMKAAIMQDDQFDNLREIVAKVPDAPKREDGDDEAGDDDGGARKRKKSTAAAVSRVKKPHPDHDDS